MRILFAFVGGSGSFDPLAPIARAAEAAGHTVAFTGEPAMVPTVRAAGFTGFAAGMDLGGTPRRLPLLEVNAEREDRVLRDGFARRRARDRAAGTLTLCAEWQPDLLVCDEVDFGGMIAAERLGFAYATVLVIAAGSFVRKELVAGPLNELRAEHGLPSDPDLAMLRRHLVLSPFPPSYRDPAFRSPPRRTRSARSRPLPGGAGTAPTVYFTLGTVFNMESGDLFSRVLAGLRDLPVNVVVTVGRHIDPAELGPQPANLHIERYIPQSSVLPAWSSRMAGRAASSARWRTACRWSCSPWGRPTTERCTLGVGRVLDAVAATPERVREAVSTVLAGPTYRRAAERLRDELAAQPGPEHAVTLLERITALR